ncbi:MAG: S1 RNA-binding domain-containing protein [Actinobacteria bacterium]|nr:S1 RNA-binding domain-containing protein [Actinomycetota bacterium]
MINERVIVDGSNIATEGRTLPSLAQLDEAVRAFTAEFPQSAITVVVDATFGHRIADDEKEAFEEAVLAGELVTPPAGAIGRGDAFVLTIADRANATVFSNDSFQEFHGQYTWLFDEGRLIGGKPVPSVGWIFVLRTPVRGPVSRRAQRAAKTKKVSPRAAVLRAAPGERPAIGATKKVAARPAPARRRAKAAVPAAAPDEVVQAAIDEAASVGGGTAVATSMEEGERRGRRRRRTGATAKAVEPVNDPLPFLEFVSAHPVGSMVEGTVDRFSSHGAYVVVERAQCYLPLRSMADPPPKSAREVLKVGDTRSFVVESFDSPRRSIDLAIPSTASTAPSGEAEPPTPAEEAPTMAPAKKAAAKKSTTKKSTGTAAAKRSAAAATGVTTKKAGTAKAATKKATTAATKKASSTASKATAGRKASGPSTKKSTSAKKASGTSAKKAASTTRKSTVTAKKASGTSAKKAASTTRKSTATTRKASGTSAKKAASTTRKSTATTRKASGTSAKKATGAGKSSSSRKTTGTAKTTATKTTARKTTAKKATARKASVPSTPGA